MTCRGLLPATAPSRAANGCTWKRLNGCGPGHVRELENWIHREVLLAEGDEIRAAVQPMPSGDDRSRAPADAPPDYRAAKAHALAEFENGYLSHVLAAARGNVTVAARMAGKERRSFGKLLKKHGIDRFRFRS
jgi:two-component system response regulator GlrR